MHIRSKLFGTIGKEQIHLYTLSNGIIEIDVMNYGATITRINVPDRKGDKQNVVAGFNNLGSYIDDNLYVGCIIGRYANRIQDGTFTVDGNKYQLSLNDGEYHLHGGVNGFHKRVWKVVDIIDEKHQKGLTLKYHSEDGEEGYPGNLQVFVSYIITMQNELIIRYRATTDKPTVVSLTNHSYFNLSGFCSGSVSGHELSILSDQYLATKNNLPTGEILSVENDSVLDFRKPKMLSLCLDKLINDKGLNHCFVLPDNERIEKSQITLCEPLSGRAMLVKTNQPAVQIYTANYWDGSIVNETGTVFNQHSAIAIETQSFTDAPNHEKFPKSFLYPGEIYYKTTVFQFAQLN